MKVTPEKIEGCQMLLTVEAEPEEMEKALDGAYRRLVSKTIVPGFRKGKAPRPMLERHIGREALVNEALDRLVRELYEQAVKEQEIKAIAQPQFELTQNEPTIFKATIPLPPVLDLGDYHAIRITPEPVKVPEEKINEALENLRNKQVAWEPVEREARLNDLVVIDIEGIVEGGTIIDDKGREYQLLPGSVSPAPGLAEQIEGMKVGEEEVFPLILADDFPDPKFAGKECFFRIRISEVKEKHLPELNDDFAKSLDQDLETIEQLREKITANLKAAAEREARNKLENEVIEAAIDLANLEFPSVLTEQEIDRLIEEQMKGLGGMNFDDYLRNVGKTKEEYRSDLWPIAEKRVTRGLVLEKVCEEEKIKVDEVELGAKIGSLARDAGEKSEEIWQKFASAEARDLLRRNLLTCKTIERLVEIATTKVETEQGAGF